MRVCAISDLHGRLPDTPQCNLLLIAGDLTHHRNNADARRWLRTEFAEWADSRDADLVVVIPGNHDFVLQDDIGCMEGVPVSMLCDTTLRWRGEVIHGSPWSNQFHHWAFMADEEALARHISAAPDDTTILITHGPPFGYGDQVARGRVGSSAFAARAAALPDLKLYVFGHIHEDRGQWHVGNALYANVTLVDLSYRPLPIEPFLVDIDTGSPTVVRSAA